MKTSTAIFLPLLAALSTLLPTVHAHGYVKQFTVDGKSYKGNAPGGTASDSPIRQISTINPVKGATNVNVRCGPSAKNAALVADVNPGSTISFAWGDPDGSNWPHNTGPLITYMASCGTTTCDKFDASNAQWFKISQSGKKPGDSSTWVQQDIMDGKPYTTQIPSDLAAGQYLIRHEIIALHLATTQGGAEFYPSCTQVKVGGSKTGTPPASDLVSFPGAYKDTDPGILDPNVFDSGATYVFPGPPLVQLGSSGSSSGPTNSSVPASVPSSNPPTPSSISSSTTKPTNPASPSPSPTSTTNSTKSNSTGIYCRQRSPEKRVMLKRENATTDQKITEHNSTESTRPKHMSRFFGKLTHNSHR